MSVRVILTRASGGSPVLPSRLRQRGFEVVECPLVRIEPIPGPPLDLAGYDWVVLTSGRAVELLCDRLDSPLPPAAVIGPGTAAALRERGLEPALVASDSTQEGLVRELRESGGLEPGRARVVFAGAEGARELLAAELGADVVHLYRTVDTPCEVPDGDFAVIASASAARRLADVRRDLDCVSIGPITTAEARRVGLTVVEEAPTHDAEGLVHAVTLAASRLERA